MKTTVAFLVLVCLLPQAAAQNETLTQDDLDGVVLERLVPVYEEMAELRQQFSNQTAAMEAVLVGVRSELRSLGDIVDGDVAASLAGLQDHVAAINATFDEERARMAAMDARVGRIENQTTSVQARMEAGDLVVQVDGDQVETAVWNVVAGPAFQSRLENGVRTANDDVATQDDVAAVVAAQPAWWIPWSAALALAAAAAVYHQHVVRPLMDGQEPREDEEDAEDDEADAEDDEPEADDEPAFVIPDEDLEDARARMRELARNTILAPKNGVQAEQADKQLNGARPVVEAAKTHAKPSQGAEGRRESEPTHADGEPPSTFNGVRTEKAPTTSPEKDSADFQQAHAVQAAEEPLSEASVPQGNEFLVEVVPEGNGQASGPGPAEGDAAAPARRHWQAYQEGKLDGEALQFALADAYPDVEQRVEMLQIAKETT